MTASESSGTSGQHNELSQLGSKPVRHPAVMSVKQWFRQLQPLPLYLMMALTILFFIVELVASHVTHALTLLVDSYHTLCNLIALTGCVITIKYGREQAQGVYYAPARTSDSDDSSSESSMGRGKSSRGCNGKQRKQQGLLNSERRLKNTFGWARMEVLLMLVGSVFLASLCFSIIVEAVQTLFHIGHSDAMHYPMPVMIIGLCGFLLNVICFFTIGGYTFHQGSFLHVNAEGNVVMDRDLTEDNVRVGNRQLSARRPVIREDEVSQIEKCEVPADPGSNVQVKTGRQGAREMLRDVSSCLFVIVCAAIVYKTDPHLAKYIDPALSILSCLFLLALSIPYMKESASILLQTIPGYIDIDSLKNDLVKEFTSIENVHEVHIWCLTPTKVYATAHIVLPNHGEYVQIKEQLMDFFHERGVTQATLQPEFSQAVERSFPDGECYLRCQGKGCENQNCCKQTPSPTDSTEDLPHHHHEGHNHSHGKGGKGHGHSHASKAPAKSKSKKNDTCQDASVQEMNGVAESANSSSMSEVRLDPAEGEGPVSPKQRSRSVCDLEQTRDSFEDYAIKRVKQTSLVDVMHLC
ncbi:proton-coupled zinc antiporter SLC30A1 isoform X2 [Cloeon dipterum]|uniref:proton-coupled zinc antiporter SLC30A1 isoform X2 n=1 Tax=Cloeon dipterum TaxID=197152 RepID=UPI0032204400